MPAFRLHIFWTDYEWKSLVRTLVGDSEAGAAAQIILGLGKGKQIHNFVNHGWLPLFIAAQANDDRMLGAISGITAKLGLGLAVAALVPSLAQARTMSGNAQVAMVTPLAFIQVENLDFGSIISSGTAGTVTLMPNNSRTATGGIILVGNNHQPARFVGMGISQQRVRIQISPNNIILSGPGPSMNMNNVTIDSQGTLQQNGNSSNYRILPSNGIFFFNVGGRLNVGANQPAGTYSGTFTATLDYN